jgi:hypothetical protein
LEWTSEDLGDQKVVVVISCSFVIGEVIRHKGAGTSGELLTVTVDTVVVQVLGNTSIVHLNKEVAVVGVIVWVQSIFTNAELGPRLGATLGQADHVRCTSHAKTIANILLIHLHEVSDFVICGEGGHGQPTISANFIDTTHILECSVSCRGTCVLATPISVQLGVPTRWAVNVLGNEHFIAVSVEVGATRL